MNQNQVNSGNQTCGSAESAGNHPASPEIPFSSTLAYDRELCGDCVCASCYKQEFCDRCSTCTALSRKKEHCYRYEGCFNY